MADKIILEDYNERTYNEVMDFLSKGLPVAIVNATGVGKSAVMLKVMRTMRDESKILLIAPDKNILTQFEERPEFGDNVEIITYTGLMASYKSKELKCRFSGYDLIVADEMHRAGAPIWGEAFLKLIDINKKAKILGATATPIRDDGRNMVDELFGGNSAGNISLKEAIIRGILPTPKYVSSIYSIDEEITKRKDKISKLKKENKDALMDILKVIEVKWGNLKSLDKTFKDHLRPIFDKEGSAKITVFCMNISHLEEMVEVLTPKFEECFKEANIVTYVFHSSVEDKKAAEDGFRTFKKEKIKNTVQIMYVVEMLNEGIHIDDLDAVIMLRPTASSRVYQQQIGRVLSKGGVENPLIIDLANNFNSVRYGRVWKDIEEEISRGTSLEESGIGKEKEEKVLIFDSYIREAMEIFEDIDSKLEKKINLRGNSISITAFSKMIDLPYQRVIKYLESGATPEEIEDLAKRINRKFNIDGIMMNKEEIAEKFNLTLMAINIRMAMGKSMDEIVREAKETKREKNN